jgi:hypothetical protein
VQLCGSNLTERRIKIVGVAIVSGAAALVRAAGVNSLRLENHRERGLLRFMPGQGVPLAAEEWGRSADCEEPLKNRTVLFAALFVVATAIGVKIAWPDAVDAMLEDLYIWFRHFSGPARPQ